VQTFRFFTIDGDQTLGVIGGVGAEQPGQILTSAALADQILGYVCQLLQGVAGLVLQFVGESAKLSQPLHRSRQEGKNDCPRNTKQAAPNAIDDGIRRMLVALTLGIRFQRDEDQGLVGSAATKAEAGDRENALDFWNVLKNSLNLLTNGLRIFERRPQIRVVPGERNELRPLPSRTQCGNG
jgi:hypothetical protein